MTTRNEKRLPVVFVGHGSPMNAVEDNTWSQGFRALAGLLPRPRVVLAISAHWYVSGTFLTGEAKPKTIHDFGGFPPELFAMQYPAPGDVELATRVVKLLGAQRASLRMDWGLDHGTWTVLHHLLPRADIPVVQLSIDQRMTPQEHLELGRQLTSLRDEGVLILGSGNVTHNLRAAMRSMQTGDVKTPAWASGFDSEVERAVQQHDGAFLARMLDTEQGHLAHPTPDHFLPLLYVVGAGQPADAVTFPISGFDLGSLSMRCVVLG